MVCRGVLAIFGNGVPAAGLETTIFILPKDVCRLKMHFVVHSKQMIKGKGNDLVVWIVYTSMFLLGKNGVRHIDVGMRNIRMRIANSRLRLLIAGVSSWW